MAIYNDSVQTNAGRVLENRARNGEGTMEFTCIKTGAGVYTDEERKGIRNALGLKDEKQSFAFSDIKLENGGDYLVLESVIRNEGMDEGYYFTELGVYAHLEGEEPVLYCICLIDEPDYVPEYTGGKIYEIALQSLVKCYDAEHVTILYNDDAYATAKALRDHVTDSGNPHGVTAAEAGAVEVGGDTAENIVGFLSGDAEEPTGWADIGLIGSGEKHKGLFRKFSLAVKNLRYLKKLFGSTDISAIGDGSLTGAVSALSTGLANLNSEDIGALSIAGGTVDGNVNITGNISPSKGMVVVISNGKVDTEGYVIIARIKIKAAYTGYPICFEIGSRSSYGHTTVDIRFGDNASNDPDLIGIFKYGYNIGVFIKKTSTSTWDLAVPKGGPYGYECLLLGTL